MPCLTESLLPQKAGETILSAWHEDEDAAAWEASLWKKSDTRRQRCQAFARADRRSRPLRSPYLRRR